MLGWIDGWTDEVMTAKSSDWMVLSKPQTFMFFHLNKRKINTQVGNYAEGFKYHFSCYNNLNKHTKKLRHVISNLPKEIQLSQR